jgi:peroxiredoxin
MLAFHESKQTGGFSLTKIEVGQPAAALDLELSDAKGILHTLSTALKKGPVLLGLYKSSCQASKAMLPMLDRIHRRYADNGLTVYGLSQDSENITKSFARRYDITYPILVDANNYAMSRAFDIFATPTVYLIRPDGMVETSLMGFMRQQVNDLADKVASELGLPPETLIADDEIDVPFFVPG